MTEEPKGLPCPKCGSPMADLRGVPLERAEGHRLCSNGKCQHEELWALRQGQPPLISTNRDKRKDKK